MTKTDQEKQTVNPKMKKGKIKRKEMFNELQTINQQKINQIQKIQEQDAAIQKIQQESNQLDNNVDKPIKLSQNNIQQVCQAVNRLMAKNKVNVKNAFQVPIIDLLDVISYNKDETQNSWKTLSATLQNDYKIYGYRVDAIHSITYSILNIMSRRETPTDNQLKQQNSKNNKLQATNLNQLSFLDLQQGFLNQIDNAKTNIEKDQKNINLSEVQNNLKSDPTLERTKRLFDEPGLKGMLTNNIGLNSNLELPLYSHKSDRTYSMKIAQMKPLQVSIIEHPLKVFEGVQKIKCDIGKILRLPDEGDYCTNKQLQKIWNNVKNKNFSITDYKKVWLDVQDPQHEGGFQIMIDENSQNQHGYENGISNANNINNSVKFINDFIKIKTQNKKILTERDMIKDGQKWLNQIDKKFLGIKTTGKVQLSLKPKPINSDDILFDLELELRQDILKKQSPTKQINEQIQDRFLTTIRPMNQFKIQKILTLRQQPEIQFNIIEEQIAQENQYELFLQKQIDVRRQTTSIREMKQALNQQIFQSKHSSFSQTYQNYCQQQGEISPALCFLTLLHLANENNLQFQSANGQMDFFIKTQSK